MASVLDICNLALARLGDDATVSSLEPPEGSQQAEHCARFWPLARDTALASHEWGFATKAVTLAQLSAPPVGWRYAYTLPPDHIKTIRVLGPAVDDSNYEMTAASDDVTVLLTDQPQALLVYVARIQDAVRYPALFVDALSWLLASHLAGPLMKGEAGAQAAQTAYQAYSSVLSRAITADIEQHRPPRPPMRTPWIEDR